MIMKHCIPEHTAALDSFPDATMDERCDQDAPSLLMIAKCRGSFSLMV